MLPVVRRIAGCITPFSLNLSNCSSAHFLPAASRTRRWACMMLFIVNATSSSLFIMLEDRIRYGNSGSAGLRRCGSLRERPFPASPACWRDD